MTADADRAVVLLGDPSDPRSRGVEEGRGVFQSWTRASWGKRTRKEHERRAEPEMGRLLAIVETDNGEVVEVEPPRVRFVNRLSKLQYPNC